MREIWDIIKTILIAFIIALLIRSFVFEIVKVQQISMQDTLYEGQKLVLNKLSYAFSSPKRGDIVVFIKQEGTRDYIPILGKIPYVKNIIPPKNEVDYVKRIIGLPGDVVDIKDGKVYINGKPLNEPYVKGITVSNNIKTPFKVNKDKIFVMGDNREYSSDSREFGPIEISTLRGKASYRVWPFSQIGGIYKYKLSIAEDK